MSVARKWMRWLPCGALLAAAGCSQFPGAMTLPRDECQAHVSAARMHESRGQLDQARGLYEKALVRDANSVEAHHRLALLNARQRRWGDAEQHFIAALRTQPQNSKILADYGYMEYCQERMVEAERTTRQALDQDPKNERILNNLGLIVGRQARYQECLGLFRQAGTEAQAHANIAWIYAQNGETDLAAQAYARAIALDGNNRAASIAFAQLCEARQPDPDEQVPSERLDRRTLPPALPRQRTGGKVAKAKTRPAAERVDSAVRSAALDDRSGSAGNDLHIDLPGASGQPPTSLKTASSIAPEKVNIEKSALPTAPSHTATVTPVQPSIRSKQMAQRVAHPPIESSLPAASVQAVAPPVKPAAPPVKSATPQLKTANRLVESAETSEEPANPSAESTNPLSPDTVPAQPAERAGSWAESISRKVAEGANGEVLPVQVETPPPAVKPTARAEAPVVPQRNVRKATATPKPAAKAPEAPADSAEPQLPEPQQPVNQPAETTEPPPARRLRVVEPLELKKPIKRTTGIVAAPPVRPGRRVSPPAPLPRPAIVNKNLAKWKAEIKKSEVASAGNIVTQPKSQVKPTIEPIIPAEPEALFQPKSQQVEPKARKVEQPIPTNNEPLPDLPGTTPEVTAKAPTKPAAQRVTYRPLLSLPRKSTEAAPNSETASKPALRRPDFKGLLSRSRNTPKVESKRADNKSVDKPAAPRPEVKPIPVTDPLVATKSPRPSIRQVSARDPNVPFLSEKEPESLPVLDETDELDSRMDHPSVHSSKHRATASGKISSSAKSAAEMANVASDRQLTDPRVLVAPPVPPARTRASELVPLQDVAAAVTAAASRPAPIAVKKPIAEAQPQAIPEPILPPAPEMGPVARQTQIAAPHLAPIPEPMLPAAPQVAPVSRRTPVVAPRPVLIPEPEQAAAPQLAPIARRTPIAAPRPVAIPEPKLVVAPQMAPMPRRILVAAPQPVAIPEPNLMAAPTTQAPVYRQASATTTATSPKRVQAATQNVLRRPAPGSEMSSDRELTLGDFVPTSEPTEKDVAQLSELLQKGNVAEREAAATALGEMGSIAASAVPNLIEALVDSNANIRNAANTAIQKIEASGAASSSGR